MLKAEYWVGPIQMNLEWQYSTLVIFFPCVRFFCYFGGGDGSSNLILAIFINMWWERVKEIEQGSSSGMKWKYKKQWAQTEIQEISLKWKKKKILLWRWSNTGAGIIEDCGLSFLEDIQNPTGRVPGQACSSWPSLNMEFSYRWSPETLSNLIYSVIHTIGISTLCWWGYCSPCLSCSVLAVGRAIWLSCLSSELRQ